MRCPLAMRISISLLSLTLLALCSTCAEAQYNCAVTIEWKGKAVLQGQIRDTERPATGELWKLLKTLSFAPTPAGKNLPDPKSTKQTTLQGELRVKVNGAGEVKLDELHLVRNPFNEEAWTIAPADMERILKMRNGSNNTNPSSP